MTLFVDLGTMATELAVSAVAFEPRSRFSGAGSTPSPLVCFWWETVLAEQSIHGSIFAFSRMSLITPTRFARAPIHSMHAAALPLSTG